MAMHSATAPVGLVPGTSGSHRPGLFNRALTAISGFCSSVAASQRALHRYEHLASLSDAQLAAYSLKREDISRYVLVEIFERD